MGIRKDKYLYEDMRYRFEEEPGSMIHYLLFEAEAIPAKVLKVEKRLIIEYEAKTIHKFFQKF